ncbi:CotS family spore coat protein [Hydrogenispora ethanolica]|uniref:CotS family spore coat protein n=1 Tax=Hydrogenispora ethanolica TaxID=1082276 RepID=A0A4V2QBY7_HYDET|nr:CotS family spore coat protein [Hydrogenispora ethanolica]TCL58267.1 CotS family spore coat protein [Hydrogenispora ethanolica]
MTDHPVDLENLLSHWGLQVLRWEKIKDVYKVETDQGIKNLKVSPLKPKRLLFVHSALKHLISNGFQDMYPYLPTVEGKTYITDQKNAYTLFDWIEGRQCDFRNRSELTQSTAIFADFHRKSFGFEPPPGSNMRDQLGKCIIHFTERLADLKRFKELALTMKDDSFAALYLEHADFYMNMASEAIERITKTSYMQMVAQAQFKKPFCHGDPAARNFILTPENHIFMIDFDSCRYDLPSMDLVKFLRRIMKKCHWDYQVADLVLDSYQTIRPLSQNELDIIKAALYFPQKFWRMAIRYFHHHQRHSNERAFDKFQNYIKHREAFTKFHNGFEHYQAVGEQN